MNPNIASKSAFSGVIKTRDDTGQIVARRDRHKPDAHHQPNHSGGRQLRSRTESHRTEHYLADRLEKIHQHKPHRAYGTAVGQSRTVEDDQKCDQPGPQPPCELCRARGLSVRHTEPDPREHRRKQNNENRLHGLEPARRKRKTEQVLCVSCSANSVRLEPACSKDIQNTVENTNSSAMAEMRFQSPGVRALWALAGSPFLTCCGR